MKYYRNESIKFNVVRYLNWDQLKLHSDDIKLQFNLTESLIFVTDVFGE